ncbi:hypothetical protein E2C01_071763 [Portunus trituberculatus]|uniref:Uncharacterized protein n=1 Tax=Portunus trituberculatus TaxID=210409 RepID=A0A5B7HW47_PORTR|nr:hypothetical protein [Portunus trituberculatus]
METFHDTVVTVEMVVVVIVVVIVVVKVVVVLRDDLGFRVADWKRQGPATRLIAGQRNTRLHTSGRPKHCDEHDFSQVRV